MRHRIALLALFALLGCAEPADITEPAFSGGGTISAETIDLEIVRKPGGYRDVLITYREIETPTVTIWHQWENSPGLVYATDVANTGTFLYPANRKGKRIRFHFRVCESGGTTGAGCTAFLGIDL